jgi:hypothetical protein
MKKFSNISILVLVYIIFSFLYQSFSIDIRVELAKELLPFSKLISIQMAMFYFVIYGTFFWFATYIRKNSFLLLDRSALWVFKWYVAGKFLYSTLFMYVDFPTYIESCNSRLACLCFSGSLLIALLIMILTIIRDE